MAGNKSNKSFEMCSQFAERINWTELVCYFYVSAIVATRRVVIRATRRAVPPPT